MEVKSIKIHGTREKIIEKIKRRKRKGGYRRKILSRKNNRMG
jgi:hypothetical protein